MNKYARNRSIGSQSNHVPFHIFFCLFLLYNTIPDLSREIHQYFHKISVMKPFPYVLEKEAFDSSTETIGYPLYTNPIFSRAYPPSHRQADSAS